MPITKKPGIYYDENVEYELAGDGAKIPVIIGKTGNTGTADYKVDGTQVLKFNNFEEANRSIANGGIGTDTATNPVLAFLEEFFEEAVITSTDQLGVPYVYVIDVGAGTVKNSWLAALTTAKTLADAQIEAYVGADSIEDYTLASFLAGAVTSIKTETVNLNLRAGMVTKTGASDTELITLASSTGVASSRMFVCEPLKFGKTVARFCTTPYYIEPGFLVYRSVAPGEFKARTNAEIQTLQDGGVIINADERVDTDVYPRINLSTSTAFAQTPKPADALGHARFNADHLLREIFKAIFGQVKANEVESYIVKSQTKVNAVIDTEVEAERIIGYNSTTGEGTKLTLVESTSNPYDMELVGQILPVNCTTAIIVKAKIKAPTTVAVGN